MEENEFEYNGQKYVASVNVCAFCEFRRVPNCFELMKNGVIPYCSRHAREDGRHVYFIKKEETSK